MKVKNIIAALLLCCIAVAANAQDKSAVVTVTKGQNLYVGVQNDVEVVLTGYTWDEDTKVSVSQGEITDGKSKGHFKVSVKTPGTATLTVTKDGKTIVSQQFRVKRMPDPVVKVNDKAGGKISKSALASQKCITVALEDFDYDVKFNVTQFTVASYVKGVLKEATSASAQFTAEQKSIIKESAVSCYVIIKDIKVQDPDGREFEVPATAFQVQ